MEQIAYAATGLTILGLLIIFISRHDFFSKVNSSVQRLPGDLQRQFNALVNMQFNQNEFIQNDQSRITKELLHSGIRFRGNPITFKVFVLASILSGILGTSVSFILTTRYEHINLPADIILGIMGFTLPRFFVLISAVRTKFKYQMETSQCLYVITSALRRHPNLERAVEDSIPNFPRYSRLLFESGLQGVYEGRFKNITLMLFWAAEEIHHPNWKEFAHIALNESFTGIKNRMSRMTILTNRADELLSAQKDERKNLKLQVRKVGLPLLILIAVIILFTFFDQADGMYLYTTPIGKLLITIVYLVITCIVLTFTWLFYQV